MYIFQKIRQLLHRSKTTEVEDIDICEIVPTVFVEDIEVPELTLPDTDKDDVSINPSLTVNLEETYSVNLHDTYDDVIKNVLHKTSNT